MTHFRLIIYILLLSFSAHASPGMAQTRVDAAASNVQLSMQLCLMNYHDPAGLLAAHQAAGFGYTSEDFGGGNILHWFTDPGQTMSSAIVINGPSVECRIGTDAWGTEQMVPFAKAAFANVAPNAQIHDGSPEGQNILPGTPGAQQGACSGFNVFLTRVNLWVQVERQGNDGTCISDGTSVMRMMF